jgi:hypothetical protein
MRKQRILAQGAWYEVRTAVNNREKLFRGRRAAALLFRVLCQADDLFTFQMRGLRVEGARLSFYIKPANGFRLPEIMQWLKQTFAVRFNLRDGRTGHIWGDRYWSRVLEGEPPEEAGEVDWAAVKAAVEPPVPKGGKQKPGGVSPLLAVKAAKTHFSPEIPFRSASPPA